MSDVRIGGVPFQEAIDHFREKVNIPTAGWEDLRGAAHAKGFTVAGAAKADLLQDFRGTIDKMIAEGKTITDFRRDFDKIVAKHGWNYKGKRGWRTRVIYNTNMRTAHMAGRWAQFQRLKHRRPYLQYLTVGDGRVRPEHAAWNGKVIHIDDPWLSTHFPPNGWGCRCTMRSLSKRQLDKMGLQVSAAPPPELEQRISTTTGEILGRVPKGIDTGWDYNVGRAWLDFDRRGLLPDCLGYNFAKDGPGCIKLLPGQRTWRDYGRPDLRHVGQEHRLETPPLLPAGNSIEEAIGIVRGAVGLTAGANLKTIRTAINETAIFHADWIAHFVEKRSEARERYAGFILPTLLDPFEVYQTEYDDGTTRSRYIGLFKGKKDMLVVVRRNRDGNLVWNVMQSRDKTLNVHRVGELILKKGK